MAKWEDFLNNLKTQREQAAGQQQTATTQKSMAAALSDALQSTRKASVTQAYQDQYQRQLASALAGQDWDNSVFNPKNVPQPKNPGVAGRYDAALKRNYFDPSYMMRSRLYGDAVQNASDNIAENYGDLWNFNGSQQGAVKRTNSAFDVEKQFANRQYPYGITGSDVVNTEYGNTLDGYVPGNWRSMYNQGLTQEGGLLTKDTSRAVDATNYSSATAHQGSFDIPVAGAGVNLAWDVYNDLGYDAKAAHASGWVNNYALRQEQAVANAFTPDADFGGDMWAWGDESLVQQDGKLTERTEALRGLIEPYGGENSSISLANGTVYYHDMSTNFASDDYARHFPGMRSDYEAANEAYKKKHGGKELPFDEWSEVVLKNVYDGKTDGYSPDTVDAAWEAINTATLSDGQTRTSLADCAFEAAPYYKAVGQPLTPDQVQAQIDANTTMQGQIHKVQESRKALKAWDEERAFKFPARVLNTMFAPFRAMYTDSKYKSANESQWGADAYAYINSIHPTLSNGATIEVPEEMAEYRMPLYVAAISGDNYLSSDVLYFMSDYGEGSEVWKYNILYAQPNGAELAERYLIDLLPTLGARKAKWQGDLQSAAATGEANSNLQGLYPAATWAATRVGNVLWEPVEGLLNVAGGTSDSGSDRFAFSRFSRNTTQAQTEAAGRGQEGQWLLGGQTWGQFAFNAFNSAVESGIAMWTGSKMPAKIASWVATGLQAGNAAGASYYAAILDHKTPGEATLDYCKTFIIEYATEHGGLDRVMEMAKSGKGSFIGWLLESTEEGLEELAGQGAEELWDTFYNFATGTMDEQVAFLMTYYPVEVKDENGNVTGYRTMTPAEAYGMLTQQKAGDAIASTGAGFLSGAMMSGVPSGVNAFRNRRTETLTGMNAASSGKKGISAIAAGQNATGVKGTIDPDSYATLIPGAEAATAWLNGGEEKAAPAPSKDAAAEKAGLEALNEGEKKTTPAEQPATTAPKTEGLVEQKPTPGAPTEYQTKARESARAITDAGTAREYAAAAAKTKAEEQKAADKARAAGDNE